MRQLAPCQKALDVAVGTGDLAIEIIRQEKAAQVVGIDLSTEMMRIGAEKAEKLGLTGRITFEEGSALALPYPDGCFEAVTCAFGIRNFSDLDAGLAEMLRVLRTGGQLVILEFSYPQRPIFRGIYNFYFNRILPGIGKRVSKDAHAYSYLNRSVKEFIHGEQMVVKLKEIGFQEPHLKTLTNGISTIYIAKK